MGDLTQARDMQQKSLGAFRRVNDGRGTASTLDNLGNVLIELSDLTSARKCFEEALVIFDEISYKRGKSFALSSFGDVLAQAGDLPAAQMRIEEAALIREQLQEHDLLAQSRTQLAMIALEKGRLVATTAELLNELSARRADSLTA